MLIYNHSKGNSPKEKENVVMSTERKMEIEAFAKKVGLSFASAKRMLEEIEADYDENEAMAEMWY